MTESAERIASDLWHNSEPAKHGVRPRGIIQDIAAALTAANQERDEALAIASAMREALVAADKLAGIAATLTGCIADDEHVAGIKAQITKALLLPFPSYFADLEARIRADEREKCIKDIEQFSKENGPGDDDDRPGHFLVWNLEQLIDAIRQRAQEG